MSREDGHDFAVIGAGITGLSIAYHLASRGASDVVVYERLRIAAEASGVQPGGVRQQWGTEINCRMARESLGFYQQIDDRLEPRIDPSFRSCGYIFLAETPEVLEQLRVNVALQNSLGIPSQLLSPNEAAEVVPDLVVESLVGAAYCEEDGYFDRPQTVVEAFADAATRHGVHIDYAHVEALSRHGATWRLHMADGSTASATNVVVASGYGSPDLLASLGIEIPIVKEARYLFFSTPISERLLDPLVVAPERQFATKQLGDGRVLASDLTATGHPEQDRELWIKRIREQSNLLLPRLEFVPLSILVEGYYDMTPDGQAILGPVDGHDGLWIAAGFSGHGFMMAPVVGDRMATALLDGGHGDELTTLALSRFGKGALVPEPQVF